MNDFKDTVKFSFGKVELGVIPEDADIKKASPNAHANRVNTALCNKMDAVDALDGFKHTLISNMSKAQYIIIRNSLEEMADLIREYEGKPLPVNKQNPNKPNKRRKPRNKQKGGTK